MQLFTASDGADVSRAGQFYRRSLKVLSEAGVEYLVGGAYALARYTGIIRHTKDFDLFLRPADAERALAALQDAGYQTDMTFPHWLGKAWSGEYFVDLIFSAGNGVATVDDEWFEHAVDEEVFGVDARLIPAEEMIWSKAYILERERCDMADVAHLLRSLAERLDWARLVRRFSADWRVILGHLVFFGFTYPGERNRVPDWVMESLQARLKSEMEAPVPQDKVCYGTLLSRAQYLIDIEEWGYQDARLLPQGRMNEHDVAHWTAAIDEKDRH